MHFGFPDMKVSGIRRLTGDGIEFAVCNERKVARDMMMKACLASHFSSVEQPSVSKSLLKP